MDIVHQYTTLIFYRISYHFFWKLYFPRPD